MFTRKELLDLECAVNALIEDMKDHCADGTAESIYQFEELQAKIQGLLAATQGKE
jgi:hypothetical protein